MKKISLNILFLILLNSLYAQYTWTGTTNTDWSTATNWSPNGIPADGDEVIIDDVANDPLLSGNVKIDKLTMNDNSILDLNTYTLTVDLDFRTQNSTNSKTIKDGNLIIGSTGTRAFMQVYSINIGTVAETVEFDSYLYDLDVLDNSNFYGNVLFNLELTLASTWQGNTFYNPVEIYFDATDGGNSWDKALWLGGDYTNPTTFKSTLYYERVTGCAHDAHFAQASMGAGAGQYATICEGDVTMVNSNAGTFYFTRNAGTVYFMGKIQIENTAGNIFTNSWWNDQEADSKVILGPNAYFHFTNCTGGNVYIMSFQQEGANSALNHLIESQGTNIEFAKDYGGMVNPFEGNLYGTTTIRSTASGGRIEFANDDIPATFRFHGPLIIENYSTNGIYLHENGTINYDDNITVKNFSSGEIRLGLENDDGTGILAADKIIDASASTDGTIRVAEMTQAAGITTPTHNFQTIGNDNIYYRNNSLKGNVDIKGHQVFVSGNTFEKLTTIEGSERVECRFNFFGTGAGDNTSIKLTGVTNTQNGGNIFNGDLNLINTGTANDWDWGLALGDFFNGDVYFTLTADAGIRIGENAGYTAKMAAGKSFDATNCTGGYLFICSTTQAAGGTPVHDLKTNGTRLYLRDNTLHGKLTAEGTLIEVNRNNLGTVATDTITITLTGNNDEANGGNTFNGVTYIQNEARTGSWSWGYDAPDVFNQDAYIQCYENTTPLPYDPALFDTNLKTDHATSLPTYTPTGTFIATAAAIAEVQANANTAVTDASNVQSNANTTKTEYDALVFTYTTCATVTSTDVNNQITNANNAKTQADANKTTADALVLGTATNDDLNTITTQIENNNSTLNSTNNNIKTIRTNLNSCIGSENYQRNETGRIRMAYNSTGNIFKKKAVFYTANRGRIQMIEGAGTVEFQSTTDSVVFKNHGNGGNRGAHEIGNQPGCQFDFYGPVYIISKPDVTDGEHADPTMKIGNEGTFNYHNDITIENYGALLAQVIIGNLNEPSTQDAGYDLQIGANQFKNSKLTFNNFIQNSTTNPINFDLKSMGTAHYRTDASDWGSNVTVTADAMVIKDTRHRGTADYTSYTVEANSGGGNTFDGAATITCEGTNYWRWGESAPDVFNSTCNVIQNGSDILYIAYNKAGCEFNGETWFTTNDGRISIDEWGAGATTNVTFNADVHLLNNGPGLETGGGGWFKCAITVATYNDFNTVQFNGDVYAKNVGNTNKAKIFLGFRGYCDFNGDVYIENDVTAGTDLTEIAIGTDDWSGAGQKSGASLAAGKEIKLVTFNDGHFLMRRVTQEPSAQGHTFSTIDNFRLTMDSCHWEAPVTCAVNGIQLTRNTFKDNATIVCYQNGYNCGGNIFHDYTTIEYQGVDNSWVWGDDDFVGDKFLAEVEFANTGTNATLYVAHQSEWGEFNNKVIFTNNTTGGGDLNVAQEVAVSGNSNAVFNDVVEINNLTTDGRYVQFHHSGTVVFNSTIKLKSVAGSGGIRMGRWDATGSDTLKDNAKFEIVDYQSGDLWLQNIYQESTITANSLTNLGTNTTDFYLKVQKCTWNSDFYSKAPKTNLYKNTFNAKATFEDIYDGHWHAYDGDNTFNDSVEFVYWGNAGEWRMGYRDGDGVDGDDFNGHVTFRQKTAGGLIRFVNDETPTTFAGGIHIESANDLNFIFGDIWDATVDNEYVFDGNSKQYITADFPSPRYIDFEKITMNQDPGAPPVEIKNNVTLRNADFTSGLLFTADKNITIGCTSVSQNVPPDGLGGTFQDGNASSYILANSTGYVRTKLPSGGSFEVLPVGNDDGHLPIKLKQTGTDDFFTIRLYDHVYETYDASNVPNGPQIPVSYTDGTWLLDEETAGGSTSISVQLGWSTPSELSKFFIAKTRAIPYHKSTNKWDCPTAPVASLGSGPYYQDIEGTITSADLTGKGIFSVISFWSEDAGDRQIHCVKPTSAINLAADAFTSPFAGEWKLDHTVPAGYTATISDITDPATAISGLDSLVTYIFHWQNVEIPGGVACGPFVHDSVKIHILNQAYPVTPTQTTWTGLYDDDWFNCKNWEEGFIPTNTIDAIIPDVSAESNIFPSISVDAECENFDLQTNADATLAGTTTLGVFGHFNLNGTLSTPSNNIVSMEGNADVNMSGSNLNLDKLRINKTAAANTVTLNDDLTVALNLDLTMGKIISTNTNLITLGGSGTVSNASDNSFVRGPMAKVFDAGGTFQYPVGKGTKMSEIDVIASGGACTFRTEYFNTSHSDTDPASDFRTDQGANNLDHISKTEYWDLTRLAGTQTAKVTLYYTTLTDIKILSNPINDCDARVRVARYNSSPLWENTLNLDTDVTLTSVTSGLMSSFGNLAIAKKVFTASYPAGFDIYWIGCKSVDWHDVSNWSLDRLPTVSDKTFILGDTHATFQPTISVPGAKVKTVDIDVDNNSEVTISTGDIEVAQ